MKFRRVLALGAALGLAATIASAGAETDAPHNVVFFVPDGLRAAAVNPTDAPEMTRLMRSGVVFEETHAAYPTLTTVNAATFATGHYPGDTGDFGNTLDAGLPLRAAGLSPTTFLENNDVLRELDARYDGNYLREERLLAGARARGYRTAAIGKTGPIGILDPEAPGDLRVDEDFGRAGDVPAALRARLLAAGLPLVAPPHGAPAQTRYFTDVATRVALPELAASRAPFVLVYWARNPDMTEHGTTQSLGRVRPGIDNAEVRSAVRDADDALGALRAALRRLGLENTTDVVVAADHGFTTIAKDSHTSRAAATATPPGVLPPGFLARDLARALGLRLFDTSPARRELDPHAPPPHGSVYLGPDAAHARLEVVADGGSDLLYFVTPEGRPRARVDAAQTRAVIDALAAQDYTDGVFVDDRLGAQPGTLPLGVVHLVGTARLPRPSMVVAFRSSTLGCANAPLCTAAIADTSLGVGQGMHGGASRAEIRNFVAAAGPDFKVGYRDALPIGNADVGRTLRHLTRGDAPGYGVERGRVLRESLRARDAASPAPPVATVVGSGVGPHGLRTRVRVTTYDGVRYVDAVVSPRSTEL